MKICYFGAPTSIQRNNILKNGLEENGAEVFEIIPPNKHIFKPLSKIETFLRLFSQAMKKDFDIMLVGFGGHKYVFLGKLICILKRKPLVFDVFISLYDTDVFDRKLVKKSSLKSKYLWSMDKYTCKVSDLVLLDTMPI